MLKLGILGYPLGHTLSPILHGFLLREFGLAGDYQAYPTPPERFAAFFERLKSEDFRGVNLTIPHKVSVLPLLDWRSDDAQLIEAVNTVAFEAGQALGFNTDVSGFLRGLPKDVLQTLPQRHALIVGAGGAARSVVAGLLQHRVPGLTIAARDPAKARDFLALTERIRAQVQHNEPVTKLDLVALDELRTLEPYGLVVQTTPVGMAPNIDQSPVALELVASLPLDALVYDLIYRPETTALLARCKERGVRVRGGLEMLLYQGVEAFELWTMKAVSPELATRALAELRRALEAG